LAASARRFPKNLGFVIVFHPLPVRIADSYLEKRLSSRERGEPEAIARMRSEARLLELLESGGVTPRLLARGEDELGPWHRLERVMVPTAAERVEAHGPLEPSWVEQAARASFAALAALHEASDERGPLDVVHADLSPTNLAVDDGGARVVVLDLDLAWWRDGPFSHRDGAFRGTIGYAAPELARGERPTPASDLFSLAAVLLYCATGKAPRSGPSFAALLAAAAETPLLGPEHRSLAGRGAGHRTILECLEHDPARRPGSARAALGRCAMC
jgi:serine/threonine protein kinase